MEFNRVTRQVAIKGKAEMLGNGFFSVKLYKRLRLDMKNLSKLDLST